MVKIEELKNGAEATYTKDYSNEKGLIGLHNLISRRELESMVVTKGTVVYTIDEQEFGEKSAATAPKAAPKTVAPASAAAPATTPKAPAAE
jgi:hypothetical protein